MFFGKKENKELDIRKINEVSSLAAKVLRIFYLILIAGGAYIVIKLFQETRILDFVFTIVKVALPLFIGLIIAWLLEPFIKWLEGKKVKRTFGAIIAYLILFLVILLILWALIPLLADQIREFLRIAPSVFDSIKSWTVDALDKLDSISGLDVNALKDKIFNNFENIAEHITGTLPETIISVVSSIFSGLGTFVLGLIIGFFLLISFDNTNNLFNFIPKNIRGTTVELLDKINGSLRKYVKGACIDCGVIFILSSIGLWLVGLKAPALFGFFCGLTNIIPYAGPYIGGAPAAIVGFVQSPTVGILVILVIAVIQFLEGNFLQPYIMSKTTKLHPVTILLGLLVFGYFFGIIGMLISTPVISVCKTIFMFYDNKYGIMDYTRKEELKE